MKIAVVGCLHGELDQMYAEIFAMASKQAEPLSQDPIEREKEIQPFLPQVVLCCGDFQSLRDENDLQAISVPQKYQALGQFHKYFKGEVQAPFLTVFIGGNHEASNYLRDLYYGGWVAPNIYFLGASGVVDIQFEDKFITVGGISGIEKSFDYQRGIFETFPYPSMNEKKSVYHIREYETQKMKAFAKLSPEVDAFLSHEWPQAVTSPGQISKEQVSEIIKVKRHFAEDISSGRLGARCMNQLLAALKPSRWFSAHLHLFFCSQVKYSQAGFLCKPEEESVRSTDFMALDKPIPGKPERKFVDFVYFEGKKNSRIVPGVELRHNKEWITTLQMTQNLMPLTPEKIYDLPKQFGALNPEQLQTNTDLEGLEIVFDRDTFSADIEAWNAARAKNAAHLNSQSRAFCEKFGLSKSIFELKPQPADTLLKPRNFQDFSQDQQGYRGGRQHGHHRGGRGGRGRGGERGRGNREFHQAKRRLQPAPWMGEQKWQVKQEEQPPRNPFPAFQSSNPFPALQAQNPFPALSQGQKQGPPEGMNPFPALAKAENQIPTATTMATDCTQAKMEEHKLN